MRTLRLEEQRSFFSWYSVLLTLLVMSGSVIYGLGLAHDVSLPLLVAAPIALVGGLIILIRPEYGAVALFVMEWGFISDIAVKYHGLPSISKPLVVILFGLLLLRRIGRARTPFHYDSIVWWILGYLFVASLGLWYADNPFVPQSLVIDVAKQAVMFIVLVNLINSEKLFESSMWLLLALGALLGALTVYQELKHAYGSNFGGLARMKVAQIVAGFGDRPRAGGTTGEPNAYGQQLLVLVPIGLWAMLQSRTWVSRTVAAVMTTACLAGIGLSFSRSTYLALAVVLGLFALHIRLNPRYLLVLIPLVGILIWTAPEAVTARFSTFQNLLDEDQGVRSEASFNRRAVEMLMAVYMFVDHPILGVGANNYPLLYPAYIREFGSPVPDEQRAPHSFYLEIAAEHGILGLITWGGIVVLTMKRLREAQRNFAAAGHWRFVELAVALQIGYAGYLFTAIFLHGAYPQFFWLQVAIACALAAIARRAALPVLTSTNKKSYNVPQPVGLGHEPR